MHWRSLQLSTPAAESPLPLAPSGRRRDTLRPCRHGQPALLRRSGDAGTSSRVCAAVVHPLLRKQLPTTARAALKSARRRERLPPTLLAASSSETRLTGGRRQLADTLSARVEPVKETISTSACVTSASPTTGLKPVTRVECAGRNAGIVHHRRASGRRSSARLRRFQDHRAAGMAPPRPGRDLAQLGNLQGVIAATTPIGLAQHLRVADLRRRRCTGQRARIPHAEGGDRQNRPWMRCAGL